jgi:hypothetical protein
MSWPVAENCTSCELQLRSRGLLHAEISDCYVEALFNLVNAPKYSRRMRQLSTSPADTLRLLPPLRAGGRRLDTQVTAADVTQAFVRIRDPYRLLPA